MPTILPRRGRSPLWALLLALMNAGSVAGGDRGRVALADLR
jgi:hypothetical protein